MKSLPWIAIIGVALLTGCASTQRFVNQQQLSDALLRCEKPGFGSFLSGDALISVSAIDGAKTEMLKKSGRYHLRPGKHELALQIGTASMREAQQYLEIDAIADHHYVLRVSRKDRDFIVELLDETDPAAVTTLTTIKVPTGSPHILPLLIPSVPVK